MPSPSRHLHAIRGGRASVPLSQDDQLRNLAQRAAAGDAPSLRSLLRAVAPAMLRVARKTVGTDGGIAEDVVQESLLVLSEALTSFRGESTFTHFACRITVLCGMNARRREGSWRRLSQVHQDDLPQPQMREADEAVVTHARAEALRRLLEELPRAQAEVIALHYIAEYTSNEIAELVDMPLETVRTRLKAARRRLRECAGTSMDLDLVDRGNNVS